MLALAIGNSDVSLSEDEAKQLAKAYVDMQRHYSSVASAKTLDTMRFVMVAATIYGSRMVALIREAQIKKDGKAKAVPANVTPIRST